MRDNSPIKRNQSKNFSSKATVENSSPSPKSSPKIDYHPPKKNQIILDPKFTNELIFEKQSKMNINQSLNIRPKNNSIYLTGIGNVNDIKTDSLFEYQNLSLAKQNSNTKISPKLSLDSLPYIYTSSSRRKENQFSPLFTCCDQELKPKLLNQILYQQKEKEAKQSKYRICKTVENSKKLTEIQKFPNNPANAGLKNMFQKQEK